MVIPRFIVRIFFDISSNNIPSMTFIYGSDDVELAHEMDKMFLFSSSILNLVYPLDLSYRYD